MRPHASTDERNRCDRKGILWAFVLVLGLGTFGPWFNCPYATTTLPIHCATISRFLSNFFSRDSPSIFWVHDSPSNLAESRYPPGYVLISKRLLGTFWFQKTFRCHSFENVFHRTLRFLMKNFAGWFLKKQFPWGSELKFCQRPQARELLGEVRRSARTCDAPSGSWRVLEQRLRAR